MTSLLHVRHASPVDADAIAGLYRELTGQGGAICVLPEQIARLAAGNAAHLLVAHMGNRVCGTLLLNICHDVMYGAQPWAVIENVVVTGALRGNGVGRALFERAQALALAQDCSKIMLMSAAQRHEAHGFFQRMGFDGERKRAFVKYRRQMTR